MKSGRRKFYKVLIFAVLFAMLTFLTVGYASATTRYVNPGDSIQDVVTAAIPGDTLLVREGTYTENVNVNKRLTIESENGADTTIVQAANPSDNVFEVTADHVNITGFTFKGDGYAGIYLYLADYCNLTNNNYSDKGIIFRQSSNNKLTNNILVECGIIFIEGGSLNHYTHEIDESNTVNGGPVYYWKDVVGGRIPDGSGQVILVNCTNVLVENQTLNHGSVGIEVAFSSDIAIRNNSCSHNIRGISLDWSSDNNISNNNIHSNSNYGIISLYSSNNELTRNILVKNGIGIIGSLDHYTHEIDESNTVNGGPVYYWKDVAGGRIPDGAGQVMLVNCTNVLVENQTLNHGSVGIEVAFSSDIAIRNNSCSHNIYGIELWNSNNNLLSKNNCSFGQVGIYLHKSSNNSIFENICSLNHWEGIHLFKSSNNLIFLNDFMNNAENVDSSHSTNFWNSTEPITYRYNSSPFTNHLGNYWSDYIGSDVDGDGIGDTLHSIDSDNDYYPLMVPWESYLAPYPRYDINEDGITNYLDAAYIGIHYGEVTTEPYPRYDINEDGITNYLDAAYIGIHYGESTT